MQDYLRATGGVLGDPTARDKELLTLDSKLAETKLKAERLAKALAISKNLKSVLKLLMQVEAEQADLERAIEAKKASISAASEIGSLFDDADQSDLNFYIENLYKYDSAALEVRSKLHVKLAMLIDCIFIWGYDAALIKFKRFNEEGAISVEMREAHEKKYKTESGGDIFFAPIAADAAVVWTVELFEKQLPSRSNPEAKFHKPPPIRMPAAKPFLALARNALLVPPEIQKTISMKAKERLNYLLHDYNDDDDDLSDL